MKTAGRAYRQRSRAARSEANTERIMAAAVELFVELPFEQLTLARVAERAGVGLQTVIRRVGTKDGLVSAVGAWVGPQIMASRSVPPGAEADAVAAALSSQYERWGAFIERTVRQEDVSPALAAGARDGREAHRAWVEEVFADALRPLAARDRRRLRARLQGVCSLELWLVLRRDGGLSAADARRAVADLVRSCLSSTDRER
jgi:AcrR family transcriptional regulator